MDKAHFRDWLMGQCVPPPAFAGHNRKDFSCLMVEMGFPTRTSAEVPTLVHATQDTTLLARTAYTCPQCQAKLSELPADCAVCGLKLVLSPHLARSFHHLFPVSAFSEVALEVSDPQQAEGGRTVPSTSSSDISTLQAGVVLDSSLSTSPTINCFACLRAFGSSLGDSSAVSSSNAANAKAGDETLRFQCPECQNFFCADCDALVHTDLNNCPGCLCR